MEYNMKCQNCGKGFTAQRRTARFCSAYCRVDYNRHKGDRGQPVLFKDGIIEVEKGSDTDLLLSNSPHNKDREQEPTTNNITLADVKEWADDMKSAIGKSIRADVKTFKKVLDSQTEPSSPVVMNFKRFKEMVVEGRWDDAFFNTPHFKALTSGEQSIIRRKVEESKNKGG